MQVIIYSPKPGTEPILLDVEEDKWDGKEAYDINDIPSYYFFLYAKDIIEGRWPEAEEFIKKDPESAYFYAHYAMGERWPEAEETIMKDPEWAFQYAKNVIKNRWPEAEGVIKNDAMWSWHYDEYVSNLLLDGHITDLQKQI